jgi:GntR family transcriptional regulator
MILNLNPASGLPLYLQLMETIKHAIETGALRPGEQLPAIRRVAEDLVMNPNTVVRAYRELEHQGILEVRQGSGAYVSLSVQGRTKVTRKAQAVIQSAVERVAALGLSEEEIRRLVENELAQIRLSAPLRLGASGGGRHD